jgi:predicted nucleic acid-binding protein
VGVSAYLDTVLVSALVKEDIDRIEMVALKEILSLYKRGELSLVCSEAVKDELAKVPLDFRGEHMQQLEIFGSIPRLSPGGLTRLTAMGTPGANPRRVVWERLKHLLPDQPDAEHVFIAWTNRVPCVVTYDKETMLKHKVAVRALCGVDLMLPSEFLHAASLSGRGHR